MVSQCLPVTYNHALRNNNLYNIPITKTCAYYYRFLPTTIKFMEELAR